MSNLIQCKACNKEIAKGVKKCVHCGKDQRNWFMRHKIMTGILALIAIGIFGSAIGGGEESATETSQSANATETGNNTDSNAKKEEKVYKLNDKVTVDKKAEVAVTKFEEKNKVGNEFISKDAPEGGTFVAIQASIKNVSEEPINSFSQPSFKLLDEKGTEYDADIDASGNYAMETDIDSSKLMSDLNPGITVNDVQVFEISKESFAKGKWFLLVNGKEKVQLK